MLPCVRICFFSATDYGSSHHSQSASARKNLSDKYLFRCIVADRCQCLPFDVVLAEQQERQGVERPGQNQETYEKEDRIERPDEDETQEDAHKCGYPAQKRKESQQKEEKLVAI